MANKKHDRQSRKHLFPIQEKNLYSSREAALIINRCVHYLRFLGRTKVIAHKRIGRGHFYSGADLFKWMVDGRPSVKRGVNKLGHLIDIGSNVDAALN
jgi:hypothetical protein